MNNQLKIFNSPEFGNIRTVEIDGKPYFVANDVARALGYKNPSDATNTHCKKAVMSWGSDSLGRRQEFKVIPEGDMYRLIAGSKLPNAEKFESWIFDEVIPSVRKNGGYIMGQEELSEDELIAQALLVAQRKIEEKNKKIDSLETEVKAKNQIIGELKPKADYTDIILNNKALVNITQIAKDYGMSGQEMNRLLHKFGVQYKQGEQWLLYTKYHDKGYTHSETIQFTHKDGSLDVKMNTKWTQKGRLFLYELLKKNGYLPVIERESTLFLYTDSKIKEIQE